MRTHLNGRVTTLASCWRLKTRDGDVKRFTDHDLNVTVDDGEGEGAQTYFSFGGYSRSAITNDESLSVDNLDVQGFLSTGQITPEDIGKGVYDGAEIRIFSVNWADPGDGIIRLRRGFIGEMTRTKTGVFKAELRGLTQAFTISTLELYAPECRADLGDHRCKIPIDPAVVLRDIDYAVGDYVKVATDTMASFYAQYEDRIYQCTTAGHTDAMTEPTYDTTVGATTTDGTAVFTAREAWTRSAVVTEVTNRLTFRIAVDEARASAVDWFKYGVVTFETGDDTGYSREIKGWTPPGMDDGEIELFLPMPVDIQVGDTLRLYKGCDKSRDSCLAFANMINFRGEPFMQGTDYVYGSADTPV